MLALIATFAATVVHDSTYTSMDLKSIILFVFLLGVLGLLAWLAWTKAPNPINWIILFVLAAAAIIIGYRFIEQL